jgi:hypothetical protein
MTLLITILSISILINILLALAYRKKCFWKMVYVDRNNRGFNSDTWYWEVPSHDGKKVWLTDEQLLAGKVRADGLESHPYIKVDVK